MEQFKGTPGPWRVVDTYHNYDNDSGIIIWNGDEQAHKPICDMGEMGDMNYAEELANARLISAAPELLEALISLSNQVARDCSIGSDPKFMELLKQWQKAHWAINKALGGTK